MKFEWNRQKAHSSDNDMRLEYDFSQGIRGKYKNRIRLGDTDLQNCEVETTLKLDGDVVQYFEQLAKRNTTSFDMQINAILRQAMKRTDSNGFCGSSDDDVK